MASSHKKPRHEEWIRLSDEFGRTEMNIICPVMKAENSVRVLYRLQEKILTKAIKRAGNKCNLTYENIQFVSGAAARGNDSNLFIKFKDPLPNDENLCSRFKEALQTHLKNKGTAVENILVDKVQDTSQTIPQPLISEYDFEMHKLNLCLGELDAMNEESQERTDLFIQSENIKSNIEELSKNYTKIAMLSQNGKGKSYILNLLMLMTADNKKEYSENNKNLREPKVLENKRLDINHEESDLQILPVVVKSFYKKRENDNRDFKSHEPPFCHQLKNDTNIETSLKGLSGIGDYFTKSSRVKLDPYFLSQKAIQRCFESTTKCIIHLRYGTLYEMKVEYFKESELQEQLYELVTMGEENTDEDEEINKKAQECLMERFNILTGGSFTEDMKETFNGPESIIFPSEVLEFAGETELYFGQGKNPEHDRLSLKVILEDLTTPQRKDTIYKKRIAAVKKIVVYLPCKILYGGKEILEMPGTDDSDPIAMDFIADALNNVHAVILLTENGFKLCEKEVKTMLSDSRFLDKFQKQPDKHRIILLAYPEKSSEWQFSSGDEENIKAIEGSRKRSEELQEMKKLLKLKDLTKSLEERISTLYILPVLHTSILAQKHKPEHEVISRHDDFLKYTGVKNLIMQLDGLVLSRQSSIFEEVKSELSHFCNEINGDIPTEDARSIVATLAIKSNKAMIEPELIKRFQELEMKHFAEIKNFLSGDALRMIKTKFDDLVPGAIERWEEMEDAVTSIAVYNPYFTGKNPRCSVLLYPIVFEDLENNKITIFEAILCKIEKILQDYKENTIKQCTEELNTILLNQNRPATVTSEFVKKAIGNELDDALKWYQGKTKRPFNEKSMEKCMDKSQKSSLRDIILKPNFNKRSVEEAKRETGKKIKNCIQTVHGNFIRCLLDLHDYRRIVLSKKLKMPKGAPRMWQQLISILNSLSKCRESGGDNYREKFNNMLTMVNASFI